MNVSVSLLSADFGHLQDAVDSVPSADFLHIDVMDGHFVPNITFGPVILDGLKTKKPFDVHLMVEKPEKFVPWFSRASYITFHAEAATNAKRLITAIHSQGCKAGISIKPNSSVKSIEPYLRDIDLVLVMSVEPGFSGQKFMPHALDKISQLKAHRTKHKLCYLIEVDGGINGETVGAVREAGADVVVAASYVFSSRSPDQRVKNLQ